VPFNPVFDEELDWRPREQRAASVPMFSRALGKLISAAFDAGREIEKSGEALGARDAENHDGRGCNHGPSDRLMKKYGGQDQP